MTSAAARPPLPLIFAITLTGITGNPVITSSLPEILDGLAAPRSAAGLVIGAMTLPGIVLAPVVGLLADRFGRREVLVPCLLLFGVAGGLGALAQDLSMLVVLRLLQGAGSSGLINLAIVLIGDHWDGVERARMIGRNAAVLTTALAVLPILGGALTELGGWQAPFVVYPLALVTAAVVWRRLPHGDPQPVAVRDQFRATLPLVRDHGIMTALGVGSVTFALIFGLILTVLPNYLDVAFGVDPVFRGVLLGVPAVGNTAVSLTLGRLRQRFARRTLLTAAAGFLAAGLGAVAAAPVLGAVAGGIVLFGIGEGLMVPNLQDLAAGAAPGSSRGTAVALFVSLARLGQTLGPIAAGAGLLVMDSRGVFAAGAVVAAFLVGVVLAGIDRDPGPAPATAGDAP